MSEKWVFEEVPPPPEAVLQSRADSLGLCVGLRAEETQHQVRCVTCHAYQRVGATMVWVPDIVRAGDPPESVTEAARQSAFNGTWSFWCLNCARKLSNQAPVVIATDDARQESGDAFFRGFLLGGGLTVLVSILTVWMMTQ